jgi:hypothetical protein
VSALFQSLDCVARLGPRRHIVGVTAIVGIDVADRGRAIGGAGRNIFNLMDVAPTPPVFPPDSPGGIKHLIFDR